MATPSVSALPAPVTPFIGCAAEYAQLLYLLSDSTCRLVTITGPGGAGKTRLAMEAVHALSQSGRLPPPILVPLATIAAHRSSPDALAAALAAGLALELDSTGSPWEQLRHIVRELDGVVVFDNAEHLPHTAAFVGDLLAATSRLKQLVTSRERLQLRGEHVIALDGLVLPDDDSAASDAVDLFVAAARALNGRWELGADTRPDVIRICRAAGGLPLAIELAASWTRTLSPAEIAAELERSFDAFATNYADLPSRHRSLHSVFDWSWHVLPQRERMALCRLAVFRGSFSRAAAVAAAAADLPMLAALVERSWLRRIGETTSSRFELLEPIRQYMVQRLAELDELDATQDRHAQYFLRLLADQAAALRGAGQMLALSELGLERQHLRAAAERAALRGSLWTLGPAINGLFHVYDMSSAFRDGQDAFAAVSAALTAGGSNEARRVRAHVEARRAWFAFQLGRQREAAAVLEDSLLTLRSTGEVGDLHFPLSYLAAVYLYLGETTRSAELAGESLLLAQRLTARYEQAVASNILGQALFELGRYEEARTHHHDSLAIEESLGNRWSMAFSFAHLGNIALAQQSYDQASELLARSLEIREAFGDQRGIGLSLLRLGEVARARGVLLEAVAYFDSALGHFEAIGNRWGMAAALAALGDIAVERRRRTAALRLLRDALALAQELRSTPRVRALQQSIARALSNKMDARQAPAVPDATFIGDEAALYEEARRVLVGLDTKQLPSRSAAIAATRTAAEQPVGSAGTAGQLTAREVEVLRLVAEGLTDAQVAERLVVSTRTVSTHLSSIYGKLEVTTRSAATRFAVEHGLL